MNSQIGLAILTGLFTLASAGFSAWSSLKANDASTALEQYKVTSLQLQNFSQRVLDSVTTLANASDAKSQVAGTIDVFSLYSLSKGQPDEKRALVYVAVASNNTLLLRLLATYLKKSPDPEDNAVQAELAQAISDKLDTIDTSSAQAGATGASSADAASTGVSATATAVLSSFTPKGTRAWMFLGEARGSTAGSPLQPSFVRPPTVPAINTSSAVAAQYVHLRDSNVTPAANIPLGGIQGVIAPGQHFHVADVTFVKISGGSVPKYAVWANVSTCPATSNSC